MIGYAWPLLVWWVQQVRGQFRYDWELPRAMVFPPGGRADGRDTFHPDLGSPRGLEVAHRPEIRRLCPAPPPICAPLSSTMPKRPRTAARG
jgi:hypothetical protein